MGGCKPSPYRYISARLYCRGASQKRCNWQLDATPIDQHRSWLGLSTMCCPSGGAPVCQWPRSATKLKTKPAAEFPGPKLPSWRAGWMSRPARTANAGVLMPPYPQHFPRHPNRLHSHVVVWEPFDMILRSWKKAEPVSTSPGGPLEAGSGTAFNSQRTGRYQKSVEPTISLHEARSLWPTRLSPKARGSILRHAAQARGSRHKRRG